jgi:hypothetical protein
MNQKTIIMKKTLFILLALTLFNCSSDDNAQAPTDQAEATILGRWVLVGFEDAIRYEFTENKRFTLYSVDGEFPTLEEFNQENPGISGHDWYYEGEKITVDLNFGNLSTLTPEFTCNNYVVKLRNDEGEINSVYFRENYDISVCTDATE